MSHCFEGYEDEINKYIEKETGLKLEGSPFGLDGTFKEVAANPVIKLNDFKQGEEKIKELTKGCIKNVKECLVKEIKERNYTICTKVAYLPADTGPEIGAVFIVNAK